MSIISQKIKRDIIAFWLTHDNLRRIGKLYPDHFNKMINDLTDTRNCRKVMLLRYTGEPLKFEAIAFEMNTDVRNVFSYHKKVIDLIISNS